MGVRWAILTGEYPPQIGGVSHYTYQLARGLAAKGHEVAVYAPLSSDPSKDDSEFAVHRLPHLYGPRGLLALDRALRSHPRPDIILVQYVPHVWGMKGMNLPLAGWIAARARHISPLWVMFHEVVFPFSWWPPKYGVLGAVTHVMARWIAQAASRSFVSIEAWRPLLRRIAPRARTAEWLPVPSNIGIAPAAERVTAMRNRLTARGETTIIGSFGSYGPLMANLLDQTLPHLLAADAARALVLLGRGGGEYRKKILSTHPEYTHRIHAPNELPAADIAAYLSACDWMFQPYLDGVSTRRTSMMACLEAGRPVISNLGSLSESLWSQLPAFVAAASPEPRDLIASAEAALRMTAAERVALGRRAAAIYAEQFSIERTLRGLLAHAVPASRRDTR